MKNTTRTERKFMVEGLKARRAALRSRLLWSGHSVEIERELERVAADLRGLQSQLGMLEPVR